jgi:hypothetical protein
MLEEYHHKELAQISADVEYVDQSGRHVWCAKLSLVWQKSVAEESSRDIESKKKHRT